MDKMELMKAMASHLGHAGMCHWWADRLTCTCTVEILQTRLRAILEPKEVTK